eukprot:scaffold12754_cov90-Isochrysis_galbana.AAC.2
MKVRPAKNMPSMPSADSSESAGPTEARGTAWGELGVPRGGQAPLAAGWSGGATAVPAPACGRGDGRQLRRVWLAAARRRATREACTTMSPRIAVGSTPRIAIGSAATAPTASSCTSGGMKALGLPSRAMRLKPRIWTEKAKSTSGFLE